MSETSKSTTSSGARRRPIKTKGERESPEMTEREAPRRLLAICRMKAQRDPTPLAPYSVAKTEWHDLEKGDQAGDIENWLVRLCRVELALIAVTDGKTPAKTAEHIRIAEQLVRAIRKKLKDFAAGRSIGRHLPKWRPEPQRRLEGYGLELHRLIEQLYEEEAPKPTAADVIDAWRSNPPPGYKIYERYFEYPSAGKEPMKSVNIRALSRAIQRHIHVEN